MKLAIISQNKIQEIFDPIGIDQKFHPDFVKALVQCPDDAVPGEDVDIDINGDLVRLPPRPSEIHIISNGAWVEDPVQKAALAKEAALEQAKLDAKALDPDSLTTIIQIREAIKKILIALDLRP